MPDPPLGQFSTRARLNASEDNFVIRIQGRGAHAARPHMAIDPIVVGAEVVLALQTSSPAASTPSKPPWCR